MKRLLVVLIIFSRFLLLNAQNITGRVVDQNGIGLSGLSLSLYISQGAYTAVSVNDGSFGFYIFPTDVKKTEELPTGYSISENYPNPFNPKTTIGVSLPAASTVKVTVYNILGQRVREETENQYASGISLIDLDLKGLPNGFYIARISIDDKFSVVRKLMLLTGRGSFFSGGSLNGTWLNKPDSDMQETSDTKIDSIVVTGSSVKRTVFSNLSSLIGHSLNVGNLIVPILVPDVPVLSSPADGATGIPTVTTLNWNAAKSASNYSLQISTSSSFLTFEYNRSGITKTNQTVTGLAPFTKYYWRVCASSNYSLSNWSAPWSFTSSGSVPDAPVQVSPANSAEDVSASPTLAWSSSNNASNYTLQVSTASDFSSFVFNKSGLISINQALSALNITTIYYWRVSAANIYGTSAWSNTWSFTTYNPVPKAPILISPVNGSGKNPSSVALTWNSSTGAVSYRLQVSVSADFSSFFFNQGGLKNTSQSVTGLNNGTLYYWRVSAANSFGESGWSAAWTFWTASSPCQGIPTVSYAGKIYNTVQIGTQCWLKENLNVGTMITGNQNALNNNKIEKYCYNDDSTNCAVYGGLYQWAEVVQYRNGASNTDYAPQPLTGNIQGICPFGWHIPSDTDFGLLLSASGFDGNALKAVGQGTGNGAGTDASGFSALCAGDRGYDGIFRGLLTDGAYFWSSLEKDPYDASDFHPSTIDDYVGLYTNNKLDGFNVRCIKN